MSSVSSTAPARRLNATVGRRFKTPTSEPEAGPIRLPHLREAWVYKRLSTHEQRKHNVWSLMQQDELEEMARREGYSAPLNSETTAEVRAELDYYGHYVNGQIHVEERDIGLSGTKNHRFRPGLAALIEAVSAGRVEAVYVVHISRLYRDQTLIDAMTFADLCKRHNVVIVTPQLTFDLNQDLYFDIYKMEVENAVRELKVMKLRLTGNKILKARHGYYDGRGIEWGYILDLEKASPTYQKLVPYEPHVTMVREMFRLALFYRNARRVRQHMLEHSIFFPAFPQEILETLGGRHCIKTCRLRSDGSWLPGKQAVRSILTNPVYLGWWLVQGEVVSKNNHQPLIDEETFWAVQEIWNPIDYRSGKPNPAYAFNAGRDMVRRALLTGKLYCGQHSEDGEWSRHYLCANFGQINKDGQQQNWYICALDYEDDSRGASCFHSRQDVIDEAV
ncbi:MAG: recombinase family protein, partial [Chloroflexota bacterium]|nr:recombinase family protein [Chloroflexota bacterium]